MSNNVAKVNIAANVAQFYQPNPAGSRPTDTLKNQLFAGIGRTNKAGNQGGGFASVPPISGGGGYTKQFIG